MINNSRDLLNWRALVGDLSKQNRREVESSYYEQRHAVNWRLDHQKIEGLRLSAQPVLLSTSILHSTFDNLAIRHLHTRRSTITMFRAASWRTVAPATKSLQSQPKNRTYSIYNIGATRPSPQARFSNVRPLEYRHMPGTRHLTYMQEIRRRYREASKGIWRKNPILMPLAVFSIVGGLISFAYISYVEITQHIPQYQKFPPPVATALRTAVYYTDVDLNPPKALKSYREALKLAAGLDVHPFSDEVLGIKIQAAMMLEKAGLLEPAVDILERTKSEALAWVEAGRAGDAALTDAKLKEAEDGAQKTTTNVNDSIEAKQETAQTLEALALEAFRHRDRVLKKAIQITMKLADLYSSDYIQDDKKAEAVQVSAVELCLKEMHRRQKLGLPVGSSNNDDGSAGDAWMNLTEIATAMAELAKMYISKERYQLAMPLYLRALDLIRSAEGSNVSCKQVSLLNDVASALVGQVQIPSKFQPQTPVAAEQTIESARQWAQKAIDVASHVQPPIRDEECDLTCVVATYNLGELAELQKKPAVAKQRYIEAKELADKMGYEDGSSMAKEALKRLTK